MHTELNKAAAAGQSVALAAAARAAAGALADRMYDFSAASFCGVSASDVEAFQEEESCGTQRVRKRGRELVTQ